MTLLDVKQSNKPKYVAHVLGGAVSKKYRKQHYYDTSKYVVRVLEGPVSITYRRLLESRKYRHKPHSTDRQARSSMSRPQAQILRAVATRTSLL